MKEYSIQNKATQNKMIQFLFDLRLLFSETPREVGS